MANKPETRDSTGRRSYWRPWTLADAGGHADHTELLTLNQLVDGSSPSRLTKYILEVKRIERDTPIRLFVAEEEI